MRALVLLLCLLCLLWGQAWGTTYYIDTSCTFNGNGTGGSGACAASDGAAGAYNTGASVTFGAGNTIYIKRGTTVTNFPSPVSAQVTIDDYGTAADCPTISKSSTFALSISAAGVVINDICITGVNSSAILNISAATASLNRLDIYGNTGAGVGVRFNTGSGGSSMTDSVVREIADDGIGVGASTTGTITITNQTCYRIDTANTSGDCLQAYTGTAANVVIDGGSWKKETTNKQAIIYDGSGTLTIKGSPQIDVSAGSNGIQMTGTGALNLNSAFIDGGTSSPVASKLLLISTTGTVNVNGLIGKGAPNGVYVSHASGTVTITHSTITGQSGAAVYHTTGGTLNIYNSYLDGETAAIQDASGSATTVENYNKFGRALWYWDGIPISSLASWQSTSSQGANSAVGAETFVGGTAPTAAAGFCLKSDSALLAAGTYLGAQYLGYGNRNLGNPPAIGALNTCQERPPAATRPAAATRH